MYVIWRKMNLISLLFLVLFIVVLNVNEGNGIKCFQCNSVQHPGCEDLTKEDLESPYLKECTVNHGNNTPFCRKSKYTIQDQKGFLRISRDCGWLLHRDNTTRCYDVDTDFKDESNCQCFTDACNDATKAPASFYLATTLITGLIIVGSLL